jgi:geranylgeranylglycerol-phosphate geranylgeranyltransferase
VEELKKNITIKNKLFAHLETWRVYTIIWCGLVSLTGSCISHEDFPPLIIAFFVTITPMMGWAAALYLSDFLDRKLDAIEKPHRPIPSGRISPKEAIFVGGIFVIIGMIISYILGIYNFILVFIVAILVYSYTKISKSKGFMGNLNRGVVIVAAYFYGIFSANINFEFLPLYIWILPVVFLFHDTNSNLVGAIRDMQGDKKGGYQTIPVKYGLEKSVYISLILTFIWYCILLFLQYNYKFLEPIFYVFLLIDVFIIVTLYVYMFRSIKDYTRKKALNFHRFFVIERIILGSSIILGIIEIFLGLIILSLSLIITITSQHYLRSRYEFVDKK